MRIVVHVDLVFENGTVYTRPIGWTPVGPQGVKMNVEEIYKMVCQNFEQNITEMPLDWDKSAVSRGTRTSDQPVLAPTVADDRLLTQVAVKDLGVTEGIAIQLYKLHGRERFLECVDWVKKKMSEGGCKAPAALFASIIGKKRAV